MMGVPVPAAAALAVVGLVWAARRGRARKIESLERAGLLPREGSGTMDHVQKLVVARETVEAIRLYRRIHGCDLRTAKAAIKKLRDEVG